MTNKELELIGQLTEVAIIVAELRAENKTLKDVNEKLMQALRIHDFVERSEQFTCRYCKTPLKNPVSIEGGYCDMWCFERGQAND